MNLRRWQNPILPHCIKKLPIQPLRLLLSHGLISVERRR